MAPNEANPQNRAPIDWSEPILPAPPARNLRAAHALALVAGFIALDAVSYFHPLHGLNITPWDPAPALGLVYLVRCGWRPVVPIALAVFLGDAWIRDLPVAVSGLLALQLAAGYGLIGQALRRRLKGEDMLDSRQGLFAWSAIVLAGTLLNSALFVATLTALSRIPPAEWGAAFARHWIGDSVGILVSMPVFWMIAGERGRALLRHAALRSESILLLLATAASLWIAFRVGAASEFKYFYVLFLPIVWAAARLGLPGAVMVAALVQIGIIAIVNLLGFSAISVLEIQVLTVVLAMLGFFVGVVVDEQRRISTELRQSLRLAAAGEMAGALAHELNQPLTALSAYANACESLLEQGDAGDRLRDAVRRIIAESERAGEVMRRLRDFFRTGSTRLEPVALRGLLGGALETFAGRAEKSGVQLTLEPVPDCTLYADRLQLEVVLRNLLANAFDAVAQRSPDARRVRVSALPEGAGRVRVQFEDSGPGLSPEAAARLFEPFESSKASGLGLGLTISRAIVEAHGGTLWAEVGDHGEFNLLLLTEQGNAQ